MLSEQLTEQRIREGVALANLTKDKDALAALSALIERVKNDAIQDFLAKKQKRAWLDGALHVVGEFASSLVQTAQDGVDARAEQREADARLQEEAVGGAGDLAIG